MQTVLTLILSLAVGGGGSPYLQVPEAIRMVNGVSTLCVCMCVCVCVPMQQGHECSLQVSEDELVSTLKHLVSGKLNVPERQQRLLFKGKALADGKRLSDYSIGPNSRLNLVVRPLEKVLLEESTAWRLAEALPPTPAAWQLISKVLARHFSAADASRVLDQLQRG
ncbi:hypothetical protein CB1_000146006 [Camelus ferus]|nr:hypothetical protein CB1_000146006 [Camelus ferus]